MDCDESNCPPKKKAKLDESKQKSCLFMPVEMENKLESLLNRTTQLCLKQSKGQVQSGLSSFSDLTSAFMEILNDNAVTDWGPNMHNSVKAKCERLLELCVCMMDEDSILVLDVLTLLFNPDNKFNAFNASKMSESVPPGSDIPDDKLYARPLPDPAKPRGWLVDLINRFGNLGGFLVLLSRFQRGRRSLTISMIQWLLLLFKPCHYLLMTVGTIVKYFVPIVKRVSVILESLTDEELRKVNIASIDRDMSRTVNCIKGLLSRVPEQEGIINNFESLTRKTILRFLIVTGREPNSLLRKKKLNVQQWNDLLEHFQTSWKTVNDKTREKLLAIIKKWVKGYSTEIVSRVLALLWDIAHSDKVSIKIVEKVINAHVEILCFADKKKFNDYHILDWLDKCVEEVKSNDKWALPALTHIQGICGAFKLGKNVNNLYIKMIMKNVMDQLQNRHDMITLVINNLTDYMDKMRQLVKENPELDEKNFMPDGRDIHWTQVRRRLDFFDYLMKDRNLSPGTEQLKQFWQCLVEQPVFDSDRDYGFWWFSIKLNGNFNPEITKDFLEQSVLQLDPTLLTKIRYQCFEDLFMRANKNADGKFTVDNLIGIDYLWQVVKSCPKGIARDSFNLLKKINEDVGSQLKRSRSDNHIIFIAEYRNQLQVHSDALARLTEVGTIEGDDQRKNEIVKETQKMIRLMEFMEGYIKGCGRDGY